LEDMDVLIFTRTANLKSVTVGYLSKFIRHKL
jgi:hypothetical protein